jgi:hypothetical protein
MAGTATAQRSPGIMSRLLGAAMPMVIRAIVRMDTRSEAAIARDSDWKWR